MQAGAVVEPDEPTCRINKLPAFKVGFWNGLYHSPAMLKELADNFRRFFNYKPYGSINHKDVLACGRVKDANFDGVTLFLDVGSIPESVGKAWNAGQLHSPSIEYWDTVENERHRLTSGFRLPNGKPPGLVLRCVTFCGNGAPAVKTLGPMPKAVYEAKEGPVPASRVMMENWNFGFEEFKNLPPPTRRFNSEDLMDKQAMIASLKAAQPWLTDEFLATMSDQQLSMMLDAAQGGAASASVADATAGAGAAPPGLGGDAAGGAPGGAPPSGGAPPLDAEKMMSDCDGDPKKMMNAIQAIASDTMRMHGTVASKFTAVNALEKKLQHIEAHANTGVSKIVNDRIRQYMDVEVASRIPPIQRAGIERRLRKCDSTIVRKFADGSMNGSELEEEMADIKKSYPVNPAFARKFSDVSGDSTVSPGGAAGGNERIQNTIRICELIPELAATAGRLAKAHGATAAA